MSADLVAFLRERLDEDEQVARYALSHNAELPDQLRPAGEQVKDLYGDPEPPEEDVNPADRIWWLSKDAADWIEHFSPARVLAEIEAKRRIVALHARAHHQCVAEDGPTQWHAADPCATLWLLALPYADHQGFRAEWRP